MKKVLKKIFSLIILFIILNVIFFTLFLQNNEKVDFIEGENGAAINIWITEERMNKLIEHKITCLFVDIGEILENGEWIFPEKEIKNFIEFTKKYEEENYDFLLLPYIEINLQEYEFSSEFQSNLLKGYDELIGLGFDGAHLDIEAIPFEEREEYLSFLENFNHEIVSVSAGGLEENLGVWGWSLDFYESVADKVDLILVPSYDFGFVSKIEYQDYLEEQIKEISSANLNSKLMFIVPTHKSKPETIQNAFEVYQNEFDGVVVFAEWTTDENEWMILEDYLKKN